MEVYVVNNILSAGKLVKEDVISTNNITLNQDEKTNAKSTIVFSRKPANIDTGFYLVVKDDKIRYIGMVDSINPTKDTNTYEVIASNISNLFYRDIIERDTNVMLSTGLEDFIKKMIDEEFKASADTLSNIPYLNVSVLTHTQIVQPTLSNNGIFNLQSFISNCLTQKNIFLDYEITDTSIEIIISNKDLERVIIDTTVAEITNYQKTIEKKITSKITVKCGDTNNVLNYYLKTDETITTNVNDVNRVVGDISSIYVAKEEDALTQVTSIFQANAYNHLIEFKINKNSKLVDVNNLIIGTPVLIKTDNVDNSYISAITIDETSDFIYFKSGNIRNTLTDKIKGNNTASSNKLDKSGGTVTGNLNIIGELFENLKRIATKEYVDTFKNIYSTDEKVIGIWTNGKPVYRKVITVSNFSTGGINVETGILNIDEMVDMYGSWRRPDVPNDNYSFDNTFMAQFGFRRSTGIFNFATNNIYVTFYGKITLLYTKTTD